MYLFTQDDLWISCQATESDNAKIGAGIPTRWIPEEIPEESPAGINFGGSRKSPDGNSERFPKKISNRNYEILAGSFLKSSLPMPIKKILKSQRKISRSFREG